MEGTAGKLSVDFLPHTLMALVTHIWILHPWGSAQIQMLNQVIKHGHGPWRRAVGWRLSLTAAMPPQLCYNYFMVTNVVEKGLGLGFSLLCYYKTRSQQTTSTSEHGVWGESCSLKT